MKPQDLSIHDFSYDLPADKIAAFPLEARDQSKLLHYTGGQISDRQFFELPELLNEGDLLVFNQTRVVQARLVFRNSTGARIEVFCLEPLGQTDMVQAMLQKGNAEWLCMVGRASKWKEDEVLKAEHSESGIQLKVRMLLREAEGFKLHFSWESSAHCFAEILECFGKIPLPPYIKREPVEGDSERYQTVYARENGSVAAPTAGLHFTDAVLDALQKKGIGLGKLTLHVGAGTFKPVKAERMADHAMHEEKVIVGIDVIEQLANCKGRVLAVGTTSLRSLESLYWTALRLKNRPDSEWNVRVSQWEPYESGYLHDSFQELMAWLAEGMRQRGMQTLTGSTGLLIAPGYSLKVAEGLITNFHQPNSTLLLLVAAVIGEDWKKVYAHALENGYRFLSYGDASLLEKK
ncbi:MAG: S-adenosylmethionine:tRNA ribosyltransferase-isomerase [Bacteroidia bacterium]